MSPTYPTLLDEYRARLAEPSHAEGGGNDIKDEMPYLLRAAEGYQQVRVLEVGVRSGRSTSAFLAACARVHGHLWSVDVNPPAVPAWWHTCGYWTFTQARSLDVDPRVVWRQDEFDIVFLDGDHSKEGVLAELRKFTPFVAKGGWIGSHDTKLTDPVMAGQVPGVAEALDVFCAETGRSWVERGGQFGLGVIEAPNG
jgi:predicted O-methyltransferase YrrM